MRLTDNVFVVTGAGSGIGRDARVMDWLTRLVPERAMTMIADRMSGLLYS